jgi:hypothetical protein
VYDAYRMPAAPPTPPKKPFWTRPKVGAAGLVLGVAIGLAGTGGAESSDDEAAKSDPPAQVTPQGATDEEVEQEVDNAVTAATGDLKDELAAQQDELAAQEEQAQADLAELRTRAKKAQTVAVKKAVKEALADAPRAVVDVPAVVEEPPAPEPDPQPSTDPQFGTCAEAKDSGYGPYYSGQDPEYDWYTDRDSDGVVCE